MYSGTIARTLQSRCTWSCSHVCDLIKPSPTRPPEYCAALRADVPAQVQHPRRQTTTFCDGQSPADTELSEPRIGLRVVPAAREPFLVQLPWDLLTIAPKMSGSVNVPYQRTSEDATDHGNAALDNSHMRSAFIREDTDPSQSDQREPESSFFFSAKVSSSRARPVIGMPVRLARDAM